MSKDHHIPWGQPAKEGTCRACGATFRYGAAWHRDPPLYCKEHSTTEYKKKGPQYITVECQFPGGKHEFTYLFGGYYGGTTHLLKFCSEHNPRNPKLKVGDIHLLVCETCGQEFTHTYTSGVLPKKCPEHKQIKPKPVYEKKPGPMSKAELAHFEHLQDMLKSDKPAFDDKGKNVRREGGTGPRKLRNL
jgi:hypothetical protein